jgi:hypothetical protein
VARQSLVATTLDNVLGIVALFAGGEDSSMAFNAVDLYDSSSGQWTTAQLSVARSSLAATSVGDVAIFAGGQTSGNPVFFCVTKDFIFILFYSDDTCFKCLACCLLVFALQQVAA